MAACCQCRGCNDSGCAGSASQICGQVLGRQKFRKRALRCHWCVLPDEPLATSNTSLPQPLANPAASQVAVTLFESPGSADITTSDGQCIPRIRHASGPCWHMELGAIKELIQQLHERSARFGWRLIYWSHEAMDNFMSRDCSDIRLRHCYFAINVAYRVARTDLFRFWLMYTQGGVWLDLRGTVANDTNELGLESIVHFSGARVVTFHRYFSCTAGSTERSLAMSTVRLLMAS